MSSIKEEPQEDNIVELLEVENFASFYDLDANVIQCVFEKRGLSLAFTPEEFFLTFNNLQHVYDKLDSLGYRDLYEHGFRSEKGTKLLNNTQFFLYMDDTEYLNSEIIQFQGKTIYNIVLEFPFPIPLKFIVVFNNEPGLVNVTLEFIVKLIEERVEQELAQEEDIFPNLSESIVSNFKNAILNECRNYSFEEMYIRGDVVKFKVVYIPDEDENSKEENQEPSEVN